MQIGRLSGPLAAGDKAGEWVYSIDSQKVGRVGLPGRFGRSGRADKPGRVVAAHQARLLVAIYILFKSKATSAAGGAGVFPPPGTRISLYATADFIKPS
jgi:hypothetical protein